MPYGFMSRYQCVKWDSRSYDIVEIINSIMRYSDSGQEFIDLLVSRLESAESFNDARKYAEELLPYNKLTKKQVNKVLNAYKNNDQIYHSFMAAPVVKGILRYNKKQLSRKIREELKL